MYALLKKKLGEIIPLNTLIGIETVSIGDGVAEARLPFRRDISNHLGTMHATAIFGLAEAASGYAMCGAFAPVILSIRPVAARADIVFMKPARSDLVAEARCSQASEVLRDNLANAGKAIFDVRVDVKDSGGGEIARVVVSWHVTGKARS